MLWHSLSSQRISLFTWRADSRSDRLRYRRESCRRAKRNLELLTVAGLDHRIGEISQLFELHSKDSHKDALSSGYILKNRISALTQRHPIVTEVFEADATDSTTILKNIKPKSVDIVFTDVPYGQDSHWQGPNSDELLNPLWSMLKALTTILSSESFMAIVSDKSKKCHTKVFSALNNFKLESDEWLS